jgi:hypothetical protein
MPDLFDAAAARDAGMSRAAQSNAWWFSQACDLLASPTFQNRLTQFTGEDLRQEIEIHIGSPTTPNAIGTLVMLAVKRGLIEKTGAFVPMKLKASHARMTPVYKWKT